MSIKVGLEVHNQVIVKFLYTEQHRREDGKGRLNQKHANNHYRRGKGRNMEQKAITATTTTSV